MTNQSSTSEIGSSGQRTPQSTRLTFWRTTPSAAGTLLLAALLSGCGRPAFPSELFTIDAAGADYPVMLSETPSQGKNRGRVISAESGTSASVSQSTYSGYNTTVTVTRTTAAQSELPASVKLAAQVRRADRWLRLERAVFSATDFTTYGAASADRLLTIDATVHK